MFRHGNAVDMTGHNGAIAFQNNLAITRHLPDGSRVRYEVPEQVVRRFIENNNTDGNLYVNIRGNTASTSNQGEESVSFTTDGLHDQRGAVGAGSTVTEVNDYVDPNNGNTQTFRISTRANGADITQQLLSAEGVSRTVTPSPSAVPTPPPSIAPLPYQTPNPVPFNFQTPMQQPSGPHINWPQ